MTADPTQAALGEAHELTDMLSHLAARGREIVAQRRDISERADPQQRAWFLEWLDGRQRTVCRIATGLRKAAGRPVSPDEWWKTVVEGRREG